MDYLVVLCCAFYIQIFGRSEVQGNARAHMVAISSSAALLRYTHYVKRRQYPLSRSNRVALSVTPSSRKRKRDVEENLKQINNKWTIGKFYPEAGRSSWFSSNSKSSRKTNAAQPYPKQPAANPAYSAPHHETAVRKETSHVQQSGNVKPPAAGWNVGGNNQQTGWKTGQSPGIPHQQNSHYPTGQQPQSPWGASGHGYNPNTHPHGYPGYPNQHGGYGGYPQHGYNPHYSGVGGYGGYGGMPGYGGMGGHHGMGGYGGMGAGGAPGGWGHGGWGSGMGGFGGTGGYGMAKSKSFFSARTIGNVMAGMLLWHVTSKVVGSIFGGGVSNHRPVNVYNYYNQPEAKEELKLPSNILTLCEGNATALCTPGTTAICTTNNTVLCVATMTQTAPCAQENALCVNTTVPCVDPDNPLCQNITTDKKEATVNLPCFTNLTVDVNLLNETGNAQNYQYCVTTMAVAGPEYKNCTDADKFNDFRSVLEENYIWNLTIQPLKRPYDIYNFKHPTEAATGDIVLPVDVLTPCVENATKLCMPGVIPVCTTFNEIMCLEALSVSEYCEPYNTTCIKRKVPCLDEDPLCQNRTEEELTMENDKTLLILDLPCFANITVNANFPNFDIYSFNGTIPAGINSSFTYHYHYCVVTLGIPGPESDICVAESPKSSKR